MPRLAAGFLAAALACGCTPLELAPPELAQAQQALGNGVPQGGFPSYAERLMLVAINRARSDPDNPALGTAGLGCGSPATPCPTACPSAGTGRADCYTSFGPQPPLMYSYDASRCSRFHCQNLLKMDFGLSHYSPCTLNSNIDTAGCDGSQSCACAANPHPNDCSASWQSGTDPHTRCGYFGFAPGGWGEVGAAGYQDGWAAVGGWLGECAACEGHRAILTSAGTNETGCGYSAMSGACWSNYYFCDVGQLAPAPAIAVLPAGVHRPETGGASTSFSFYVNYYSTTGAPQSVQLVLDGSCYPMSLEIGGGGNATFKLARALGDSACHRYWFLATDGAGARATWPDSGAWGVGSCEDYVAAAPPASCETCVPGGACTSPDGCQQGTWDCSATPAACTGLSAMPDGSACATGKVCFQGTCTPCAAGAACASADGCQAGTTSCSTGQSVCVNFTDKPDGTTCVAGECLSGACAPAPGADAASPGLDASAPESLDASIAPVPADAAAAIPDASIAPAPPDAATPAPADAAAAIPDGASELPGDGALASGPDAGLSPLAAIHSGCGCDSTNGAPAWIALGLSVFLAPRRRR